LAPAVYIRTYLSSTTAPEITVLKFWYVGNLSGIIRIPVSAGKHGVSGWTLFGPGGGQVPDGDTTVMLLGAALGALGMARRFLLTRA
jgi:hypothetical protein